MKSLEDQLNELIAESDRVSAELNRELFLIGRADAAITYLRVVREQTAVQVAALLEQRAIGSLTAPEPRSSRRSDAFGSYDPEWPQ
jgi:hypothetical protein